MPFFEVQMRWRNRLCPVPIGKYNSQRRASTFIDAVDSDGYGDRIQVLLARTRRPLFN
jgi:hypothetical protein